MDTVVEKIKDLLKKNGVLQKDFAKKIGVSVVTVNSILNSKQGIKVEMLQKIADVFGVPTSYFFNEKNTLFKDELQRLKEDNDILRKLIKHQDIKVKNIFSTIKYLIYEILLHSSELQNVNAYNNLSYFLEFYKDDLDKDTIKRIKKLTQKHEMKLGKNSKNHPKF